MIKINNASSRSLMLTIWMTSPKSSMILDAGKRNFPNWRKFLKKINLTLLSSLPLSCGHSWSSTGPRPNSSTWHETTMNGKNHFSKIFEKNFKLLKIYISAVSLIWLQKIKQRLKFCLQKTLLSRRQSIKQLVLWQDMQKV